MKSLKLDNDELHMRLKRACVESQTTMLDAVRQMVGEWVEDVEKRTHGLQSVEPSRATPATRQKPGRPSRHQTLAANGQQEFPTDEPQPAGSTKREPDEKTQKAPPHRRGESLSV